MNPPASHADHADEPSSIGDFVVDENVKSRSRYVGRINK